MGILTPGKSAADDAAFESLHLEQDLTSYIRADISQSECSDEHGQQTDVHVKMSSLSDKRDIDSSISINTMMQSMRRKNNSKQIASMQMSEMLTSFCADVVCSATNKNDISLNATTVRCRPELRTLNSLLTRIPDDLMKYHPTIAVDALCDTDTDKETVAETHGVTPIQRSIISVGIAGDAWFVSPAWSQSLLEPTGTTHDILLQECDCVCTCHARYAFNDHQKCHILARSMLSHTNTIRVCRPSVR